MCVIIVRNPGIEIPEEKIASACIVNSDGFGLSVIDRGRIETIKMYDPKGNNPETVQRALEDAKDHRVYLHLRFATRGGKSFDNCHPFDVYNDDDYHVQFMHNGTLGQFGSESQTDSEHFAHSILKPLIRRTLNETDNPLHDEFVQTIVKQYAGSTNRFVLLDNKANDFIHGSGSESKWHDDNGWWSSNVYSFNRTHRSGYTGKGYYYGGKEDDKSPFYFPKKLETTSHAGAIVPKAQSNTTTIADGVGTTTKTDSVKVFPKREPVEPEPVLSFCEIAGMNSISEVCDLDKEAIMDILDDKDIAYALLRDLIFELYEAEFTTGE
jgi:hypothetical protein